MSIIPRKPLARSPALERMLTFCHTHSYNPRQRVARSGNTLDTLYFIESGSLAVTLPHDDSDQEIVLAYLNKGEFVGELGLFLGPQELEVTVTTREACKLAEISYARLHQLLHEELKDDAVEILLMIGNQVANRLLKTNHKVSNLAFLDVTGRIASTLMDLAKQPDAMTHPDGMQIKVTRQELGRIVGCSREMAGRVLKSLEDHGLISAKGKTVVVYGTR